MRIGILSDIHENVRELELALQSLQQAGAERLISLGDVCEDGSQLERTCELLAAAGVEGVWGNHDYGMCSGPLPLLRQSFRDEVLGVLRGFRAELWIDDIRFAHIEPGLDPDDFGDLWNSYGLPVEPDRLARIWAGTSARLAFMGHLHCRYVTSPDGPVAWDGRTSLTLEPGRRYLIVAGAVCDGAWTLLDTERNVLIPNP